MKKKDILETLEPYNDEDTVVFRDGDNYVVPNRVMKTVVNDDCWHPNVVNDKTLTQAIVIDNDQI